MTTILVTTGAESSGKTTLARQLGDQLAAPVVEEASRPYLNARRARNSLFEYQAEDLFAIATRQYEDEQAVADEQAGPVVCDTDLLVIMIWYEEKYGDCHSGIRDLFEARLAQTHRHYFLCHWDIPWEPDPLRENPHDRDYLFDRYRKKLQDYALPFVILEGSEQQRLQQALSSIAP